MVVLRVILKVNGGWTTDYKTKGEMLKNLWQCYEKYSLTNLFGSGCKFCQNNNKKTFTEYLKYCFYTCFSGRYLAPSLKNLEYFAVLRNKWQIKGNV